MADRPDGAAQAAIEQDVRREVNFVWLDIAGEEIRVTDAPYSITLSDTGDEELDGTFDAVASEFVSIGPVKAKEGGGDTFTMTLSGLASVDDETMTMIGDKARWQGRDCRTWKGMLDLETLELVGVVWAEHTAVMSVPKVVGDQSSQTIVLEAESYTTFFTQPAGRTYLDQQRYDPGDRSGELAIAIANGANARS